MVVLLFLEAMLYAQYLMHASLLLLFWDCWAVVSYFSDFRASNTQRVYMYIYIMLSHWLPYVGSSGAAVAAEYSVHGRSCGQCRENASTLAVGLAIMQQGCMALLMLSTLLDSYMLCFLTHPLSQIRPV